MELGRSALAEEKLVLNDGLLDYHKYVKPDMTCMNIVIFDVFLSGFCFLRKCVLVFVCQFGHIYVSLLILNVFENADRMRRNNLYKTTGQSATLRCQVTHPDLVS